MSLLAPPTAPRVALCARSRRMGLIASGPPAAYRLCGTPAAAQVMLQLRRRLRNCPLAFERGAGWEEASAGKGVGAKLFERFGLSGG